MCAHSVGFHICTKNNITISYSVPHVTLVGGRQEIEGHVVDLVTRLLLSFLRLWAESRKAMWRLDLLLVLRFDQRLLLSCHDIGSDSSSRDLLKRKLFSGHDVQHISTLIKLMMM